jgi:hypothetical protein
MYASTTFFYNKPFKNRGAIYSFQAGKVRQECGLTEHGKKSRMQRKRILSDQENFRDRL